MQRALRILTAVILSGCATTDSHVATREEIVAATERLVAEREHWQSPAHITTHQDEYNGTWRAEVNEYGEPIHNGEILFVPGTTREILFTRSGRLISYYVYPSNA